MVLRGFGIAHDLTPILHIGLFLARAGKVAHVIIRETAEHEKDARPDTRVVRDRDINRTRETAGRHKAVRDVLV